MERSCHPEERGDEGSTLRQSCAGHEARNPDPSLRRWRSSGHALSLGMTSTTIYRATPTDAAVLGDLGVLRGLSGLLLPLGRHTDPPDVEHSART